MNGLFDALQWDTSGYGGRNGGLLGMLDNYRQQMGIQPSGGLGPNMPPQQAEAEIPSTAQPVSGQMPQVAAQPQIQTPEFAPTNHLMAGLQSFVGNLHNGPIGAIAGGLGGLISGERNDQSGTSNKATFDALVAGGVPAQQAMAAIKSGNKDILKYTMDMYGKQEKFRPATPEERKAAGVEPTQPLFIDSTTGKPQFGPAQTNVNVSTEKTGQAELATKGVNAYVEAQTAAREAQKRIGLYDVMDKAAQGFTPGATAEMRLTAKKYLKDAGIIQGDDVPDGEILQMLSRQLGIHAQPKGQGAVSNYEREMFAKSLPNMTQSPEGLKQAINISRKLEQFDQKVAEIYRESARANKGPPNYLDVQDKIAALGSPLGDREMAALRGNSAATAPAPAGDGGWQTLGNGVKIRPKGQ